MSLIMRNLVRLLVLPTPQILYTNNHILVINKPPGWHSIPNLDHTSTNNNIVVDSSKCLLTYLQKEKLGGGSQNDYLKPLHRLDQPCSGILLFGKTTKAAQRIQKEFANKNIQKTYYVVVNNIIDKKYSYNNNNDNRDIHNNNNNEFHTLSGTVIKNNSNRSKRGRNSSRNNNNNNKGWSVQMEPILDNNKNIQSIHHGNNNVNSNNNKVCTLRYRVIASTSNKQQQDKFHLLKVITNQGSKHMIRALLSCHNMIIVGDYRYGYSKSSLSLSDKSVALHAYSITLPDHMKLGNDLQRYYYAPMPILWKSIFGFTQEQLDKYEKQQK